MRRDPKAVARDLTGFSPSSLTHAARRGAIPSELVDAEYLRRRALKQPWDIVVNADPRNLDRAALAEWFALGILDEREYHAELRRRAPCRIDVLGRRRG